MVIPDTEKLVYEIDGDIIFKPVAPIRKPKPKGGGVSQEPKSKELELVKARLPDQTKL